MEPSARAAVYKLSNEEILSHARDRDGFSVKLGRVALGVDTTDVGNAIEDLKRMIELINWLKKYYKDGFPPKISV